MRLGRWLGGGLAAADHFQQCGTGDQFDGLPCDETLRIGGVGAYGDDLHRGRATVCEKAEHLPDHFDVNALRFPALALHERQLALLAERQV